jgi:two-component system CheB/CheR fusion protein
MPKRTRARGPTPPHGADADSLPAPALEDVRQLPHNDSPPIVGIGASAGGLDAFTRLIGHLPPDTGLAYVLVQHLDPSHESMLAELLARSASVPVTQAVDGMKLEANKAYVIPPNTTMTVNDGHLRLVGRAKADKPHLPVDAFLQSLAEVHGSGAIGVILSGAGSDGSRGIEAIKSEGGITIAQDPGSARFPSMPLSAVATGYVDFVLPPEAIAAQLTTLGRHVGGNSTARQAAEPMPPDEAEQLNKILLTLRNRTGVDFRQYRRGTVQRRILRRMLLHRQDTHQEYLAHLRANPPELDALYDDLLIGVTSFFRDPDAFEALQRDGFAAMMTGRSPDRPIRVWVAGCSGGEEAYSVAIVLLEFLGTAARDSAIQIFATDLSETAITRARAGLYPEGIASVVSPERLQRFFVEDAGGYRISKAVRDLCVFSRQNIVRDPPFSHLDLITCRNVLIYLDPALQRRVFPIFHYALEPNGLLLLGSAESVGSATDLFVPLDKRHKIFRRRPALGRPLDIELSVAAHEVTAPQRARVSLTATTSATEVQQEADRLILARYAPGGVVVNDRLEILQFRGRTSGFLEHPPGAASLELLKLVRAELVAPLRTAIQTARSEGQRVGEHGIAVRDGSLVRQVAFEVIPFRVDSSGGRYFIVTFQDEPDPPVTLLPSKSETAESAPASRGEARRIRELREELATLRRYVQSVVEEHEAATEELRAASEEVQSSNEELQSTNEELETTKEEIQSTNEELETVNEELRHRNRELHALSSDLANVLAGTYLPIVMVGADLRLRRFTPAAERVMKVIPTDLGRPLEDLKLRVDVPDLIERILTTIETLAITEMEVADDEGRWWALTIRPYQTVDRKVDGAVLVFADVDASKQYGARMAEASEARRQLLVTSEVARSEADAARQAAELANRAKSGFLASMSHDLRTPLNAIAGYTDLLALGVRGPVTETQAVDLERIKRSTRHLLSLINDILNFVRIEEGHVEFRIEDVPLDAIVAELEDMMGPQFRAKSITLAHTGCDAIVRADSDRLRQVLLNLLTNAVKFTGEGGRVDVICSESDAAVTIEVRDTGVGISPHDLQRIFEPFVQVNRSLTSITPDGIGLGLAISRDLARGMGADLTVESVPGKGSRFALTLPRAAAIREPHAARAFTPYGSAND